MPIPPNAQPQPETQLPKAADPNQLTEAEESVIAKLGERMKTQISIPQLKKSKDGRSALFDHPKEGIGWALLMNALGTTNINFAAGVQFQLANITAIDGQIDENNLNFAFSILTGIKPNDQEEAMLGVLQVASYLCAVKMAGHLYSAETTGELEYAERVFSKCARTCATLSETLMRKRSGSQQNVKFGNLSVVTMPKRS